MPAITIWMRRVAAPERWRRRLAFWGGAVATGAAAVLFALASNWAMRGFSVVRAVWPWWPYLCAPCGLALCAWLTRTVFPGAEGSGIPQCIAALSLPGESDRDRLLSLRISTGKVLVTLLALLCGASVGREGPTVQVGASLMHALRRIARFHREVVDRGLILAGAAAGVAAAFNTPLAGVVFAVEELARSFEERTSGVILLAVVVAGVTSLGFLGNYTYFGTTAAQFSASDLWSAVPVCGVAGGLAGGLFSRILLSLPRRLPATVRTLRARFPVLFAASCGLLLALLGTLSHGTTFGTGYAEARSFIEHDAAPVTAFALLKALATIVSYVSGVPGGLFAPSLAVGAGLGAHLHALLPQVSAGVVVLLSMAAYFAGVVQAPLTALVIVTEMTGNRGMMLPLMAAALIGRGMSGLLCREPLYRALAASYLVPVADVSDKAAS